MTDNLDDFLDGELPEPIPDYGDRLEAGFAIMAGRELQFDLPEDSNGADYEFDEEHKEDDFER